MRIPSNSSGEAPKGRGHRHQFGRPATRFPRAEAYSTGCPDLSPDRRELLFTANTTVGGAEIRHSKNPDGRDAKPVTPGSDPAWLMNGEEFAYSIDGAHAAVFSLPTMKFRLLADPGPGSQQIDHPQQDREQPQSDNGGDVLRERISGRSRCTRVQDSINGPHSRFPGRETFASHPLGTACSPRHWKRGLRWPCSIGARGDTATSVAMATST